MTEKQRTLARVTFVLYLIAVAWLCFGNFGGMDDVPSSLWGLPMDKVVHFLMFFPYPLLAFLAIDPQTEKLPSSLLWTMVAFLTGCLVAGTTEIVQARFLPYRTGDIADFKADLLALVVGSVFIFVKMYLKQKRS